MEIYVLIQGDLIEFIAQTILDMDEQGSLVTTIIGDDNIFYLYDAVLDITFVRFSGRSWGIMVAEFLSHLESKEIHFSVDSNVAIPYVLLRQPSDEILGKAGSVELPPVGDIGRVIDYANRLRSDQTVKDAAEAIGSIPADE